MVAPAVAAMAGVRLAAACDTNRRALDAFASRYEASVYTTIDDLCGDASIDVVWIATPNTLHASQAVFAMDHGKHVIVEKPMALSLDDAQAMLEAAERNGVQLICGGSRSSSAVVRKMRELVVAGGLGPVQAMTSWAATDWMLRPRRPDEYDVTKGGGIAFRQAPHQVDSVRLLAGGKVRSVRAITGAWMKPRDTAPGNYTALLEFENGAYATLVYGAYGYFVASELFEPASSGPNARGLEARLAARSAITSSTRDEAAAKEELASSRVSGAGPRSTFLSDLGLLLVSCERGEIRQSPGGVYVYSDGSTVELPIESQNDGLPELVELRRALYEGRPALHDGAWSMATLEVCIGMMQSSAEHRDVQMQHQVAVPDVY
jgi:phthalate 4,5-cis-dihydrodiol dehydrogenase